ncbi:MAG: uracil-DNA glycosylase family protein [Bacteroidota bacterium]
MNYYSKLKAPAGLPDEVEVMNPYQNDATFEIATKFYFRYYADTNERIVCFGINPGRFGAGVTGVPFTDPIILKEVYGIDHLFDSRAELSSRFIYEVISAYGGPELFYAKYYISAVSPLGYLKDGINLNYYDIKGYKQLFEQYAVEEIRKQFDLGLSRKKAFSIGKGQNIKFLNWLNDKYKLFETIIPLPHPRWVMQYRLKHKDEFIQEYIDTLSRDQPTQNHS